MKVISYSLFGYNKPRNEHCFDFNSYLRGLLINIRLNRLLFPDWKIIVQTDVETHGAFGELFQKLPMEVRINEDAPLTKAMLWRLKPLFETEDDGSKKYTHVICRDLDSPPTFREAQCVAYWISRDKAAHAITDSISHTIPMMGGMVGFIPKYFTMLMSCNSWEELMAKADFNFSVKGADQTFLNSKVYPAFAQIGRDSITQHYMLGMPNTFLSDWHNKVPDIEIGLPFNLKESNEVAGHIGAAGFYDAPMFRFLRKYKDEFKDLLEIEKDWPIIFYWTKDGTFE